jgi:hypothetical protein
MGICALSGFLKVEFGIGISFIGKKGKRWLMQEAGRLNFDVGFISWYICSFLESALQIISYI